jgi:hypothetical protein
MKSTIQLIFSNGTKHVLCLDYIMANKITWALVSSFIVNLQF